MRLVRQTKWQGLVGCEATLKTRDGGTRLSVCMVFDRPGPRVAIAGVQSCGWLANDEYTGVGRNPI